MSENDPKVGTGVSTNLFISYTKDGNKIPIGAIQSVTFVRSQGRGVATIERIVFDGNSLEDFFGTPDDPTGCDLYIEDKNVGVSYCFSNTMVQTVTTSVSVDSFVIKESIILVTDSAVKRVKVAA